MAKYDSENFKADIETLYKAQLNTEIGLINTEKGDSLINTIETGAWFFMDMPSYKNFKAFVVWGLVDATVEQVQEDDFVKRTTISFEVVLPDNGEKDYHNNINKLLRYSRALEQVAIKNYDEFQSFSRIKVESLQPTTFFFDKRKFLSVGVNLTAAITAR